MDELDLFAAAIAVADSGDRNVLLDRECAGRPDLRRRLDQLLDAHARSNQLFDAPLHANLNETTAQFPSEQPGEIIAGRYKLLELIGEGGMGAVWAAEQSQPVRRKVALKLIKAGMDSRSVLARFEQERQALALMDHPNIAKVLDGGLTDRGRPYFVMEYVKGVPITEYCDAARLNIADRLALFVQVCHAVQHAHQKGIIHRDLKPSNILVAPYDDKPLPKIIDFGLAKAMHQSLTEKTIHTAHESVLGTPLYMSPEQAQLNNLDVDTRSDVYSLGVLLYELLTGTTPLEKKRFKEAAWDEVRRLIREEEPPRPSARLSSTDTLPSIAAGRQTEPVRLTKLVRGELDWIVMKALEKDRTRRYETANGFAMDVQRHLAGEPVLAAPLSAAYRLKKFVRRHKRQVTGASFVLFALLAGMAGTSWGLIEARHAKNEESERADGERIAREAAVEAQRNAEAAAAAEKAAKEREAAQRARAERSSDRTQRVLDAMVSDVAGDSLSTQKRISAEQRKFLAQVLTYYRELAAERGEDEKSRARTANAAMRIAAIEYRLGRVTEAVAAIQAALPIYEALAYASPAMLEYRHNLALCHNKLGQLLMKLGRWLEAETQFDKARAISEALAAAFPAVPEFQRSLANDHNSLAIRFQSMGRWEEAERHSRNALTIKEKLAAAFPAVPDYRRELANGHICLGNVLIDSGRAEEAETQYRISLLICEALAAAFPAVPEYRWDLANDQNDLGLLLVNLGHSDKAEAEYRKAVLTCEALAAAFPAAPEYRRTLAMCHNSLGLLLAGLGRREDAETEYRKALPLYEALTGAFPAALDFQVELGGVDCNLGLLLRDGEKPVDSLTWFQKAIDALGPIHAKEPRDVTAKEFLRKSHAGRAAALDRLARSIDAVRDWDRAIELSERTDEPSLRASRATSRSQAGQAAEAVSEVAELTTSATWDANQWYDFACVYSLASGKVANKKKAYADRAMELLQQAVKAGFRNAAHMKKDPDLEALRARDDFKMLVAKLDTTPTSTKGDLLPPAKQ